MEIKAQEINGSPFIDIFTLYIRMVYDLLYLFLMYSFNNDAHINPPSELSAYVRVSDRICVNVLVLCHDSKDKVGSTEMFLIAVTNMFTASADDGQC